MPKIIPIRELRDTNAISEMCHNTEEPVFITKNGFIGDIPQRAADPYAVVVPEIPADLPDDHRNSVR